MDDPSDPRDAKGEYAKSAEREHLQTHRRYRAAVCRYRSHSASLWVVVTSPARLRLVQVGTKVVLETLEEVGLGNLYQTNRASACPEASAKRDG